MTSVSSKCPEGNVSRMENKKAYRDGKIDEEEGGGVGEELPLKVDAIFRSKRIS